MMTSKIFDYSTIDVFLKSEIHCLVTSCFIASVVFIVYILFRFVSVKFANWIVSIIYGTIILSEIGLSVYTHDSGSLMGKELFIRPFSEVLQTISASMNIYFLMIITLAFLCVFSFLTYFLNKKVGYKISYFAFPLILISIPLSLFVDNILDGTENIEKRNNEMSKLWFMTKSSISVDSENKTTDIKFDESLIDEFIAENDYIVPDKQYPLERVDNVPDVLGGYFCDSDAKPDVVILVVESLGAEMMGENTFALFLDSLSQKSLYWKNCLATTIRSYGAVPSITSSVMGPKGFQFGVMPTHNSMFDIFKLNGYKTSAFYGGDFSFDFISEFLINQDIDYMSDFYADYKNEKDKNNGNWWGYFDHVMFDKSLEIIKDIDMPMFNLFITITNHEALNINDEGRNKEYFRRADDIIAQMKPEKASLFEKNKARFCSMLYTDDCIKHFLNEYKKHPNYDNTIFVITGDHSSGLIINNKLSYHTVPLIIWSPMLEESQTFTSIVTHNDIAPSLNAMMRKKYNLKTPEYVHWVSDGLDTSSRMNFSKKMVHVNYSREMREMIYDNYMYWEANQWEWELVNKIDENLEMEIIWDDSLKEKLNKKLELYKYIYRYTYYNDKLTQNPINQDDKYNILKVLKERSKIVCKTPNQKPSEVGSKTFDIFDIIVDEDTDKIKFTLDAKVYVNDSLWQDEYMDLVVRCKEIESGKTTDYIDKVTKFIKSDVIRTNEWYDLSVSNVFMVTKGKKYLLSAHLSSVMYDDQWIGGSRLTIGERTAKIEIY